jgi:hypothetical protein
MQRAFRWTLVMAMVVTGLAVCASLAQASVNGDTISIAFARDEPPNTPGCMLAPTDVAGLPTSASANWVNEVGNAGLDTNLTRDKNGVATTTSAMVSWSSNNTWATEARDDNFFNLFMGADETLMTGYLDSNDINGGNWPSISVTGLPADIAAGYSVVIYTLSPVVGRGGLYFVNDPNMANPKYVVVGGNTYYKHPYGGPNYVAAAGTDPDLGATGLTDDFGNCVVFTGLTGDLTITTMPMTFRVVINAIQIVKNP